MLSKGIWPFTKCGLKKARNRSWNSHWLWEKKKNNLHLPGPVNPHIVRQLWARIFSAIFKRSLAARASSLLLEVLIIEKWSCLTTKKWNNAQKRWPVDKHADIVHIDSHLFTMFLHFVYLGTSFTPCKCVFVYRWPNSSVVFFFRVALKYFEWLGWQSPIHQSHSVGQNCCRTAWLWMDPFGGFEKGHGWKIPPIITERKHKMKLPEMWYKSMLTLNNWDVLKVFDGYNPWT